MRRRRHLGPRHTYAFTRLNSLCLTYYSNRCLGALFMLAANLHRLTSFGWHCRKNQPTKTNARTNMVKIDDVSCSARSVSITIEMYNEKAFRSERKIYVSAQSIDKHEFPECNKNRIKICIISKSIVKFLQLQMYDASRNIMRRVCAQTVVYVCF